MLPESMRKEVDQWLVGSRFSNYKGLEEWLLERGWQISSSALQRHGQALERRIEAVRLATEQAEALVTAAPDDGGAVADAILRLSQQRILDVLMASEGGDLREISAAARAAADTARAGALIRAERRKILAEAAAAVQKEGRALGLSDTVLDRIDAVLMPAEA